MNNQDSARFREVFLGLSVVYEKNISTAVITLYWNAMKNVSIEDFETAVNSHMTDPDRGIFFPKPADLFSKIVGTAKAHEGLLSDRASIAWDVIMGEIQRIGSWGTLKIHDAQAMAAVRALGGWSALCGMSIDKLVWAKKEFITAYSSYDRTPIEQLPNKLPGRVAIHNQKISRESGGLGIKQVLNRLKLEKKS